MSNERRVKIMLLGSMTCGTCITWGTSVRGTQREEKIDVSRLDEFPCTL